jgi:hypothetical protein
VRVEADDLPAPLVATWPETVPTAPPREVALEIEVAPGRDRRVSVELALAEPGAPLRLLVAPLPGEAPATVDVAADRTVEVDVAVADLPAATLRAAWESDREVASVAWVDERLGAVYPPVTLAAGRVEVDALLPAGRTYWPRLALADGSRVDLADDRVWLDPAGAAIDLDLD